MEVSNQRLEESKKAIKEANKFLYISMAWWLDDSVGRELFNEVKNLSKKNVDIRVEMRPDPQNEQIQQKLSETALPIIRIDGLTINPRQNTSIWAQALGREIGDRITVNIVNTDGSTFSDELFIESITHNVNASSQTWNWTLTLSPASTSSWVLGQALLGVGTRFAYG